MPVVHDCCHLLGGSCVFASQAADAVGTMNEAFIPELIDTLEREGKKEWADTLRGYWEGKVERFVMKTPNLYGSEFAFDSTGFESTGAFANYALTRDAASFRQKVPADAAQKFMNFQLRLNMADRGWLEQDPTDYLRLGYASSLSSWALVNSGTAASGFGYWFPGENNDGATGGGFMPEPIGRAWIGKQMPRGAWYYSAEEDVGYCGALRTHATIVTRDPVFGPFAYGGVLTSTTGGVSVIPRDGLRVRFHVVRPASGDREAQRLHMELDHDGFAREKPITVSDALDRLQFVIENRTGGAHETGLAISGLPPGNYTLTIDGRAAGNLVGGNARSLVPLRMTGNTARVTIARVNQGF